MRNAGVVVYTSSSKDKAEYCCKRLMKYFAMPLYFTVEYIDNKYTVLFDPWDGYLCNTSGYVDEIKNYIKKQIIEGIKINE